MKQKLRIHIVPVGFEIDRIVEPLKEPRADKVYLITHSGDDLAKPYLVIIEKELKKLSIKYVKHNCNRNDVYGYLKVIREIIDSEHHNLIYINVSSGGKISTVAGVMASMMFGDNNIGIEPYYVEPLTYTSQPEKGKNLQPTSKGIKEISTFYTFKTHLPDMDLVKVMKFISKEKETTRKQIVKFIFSDNEILNNKKYRTRSTEKNPDVSKEKSNEYMWVNRNFLDKLQFNWKFIIVEGKGKNSLVKLNSNGKDIIKFL